MSLKLLVIIVAFTCLKISNCDVIISVIDSLCHHYNTKILTAFLCHKNDSFNVLHHFAPKFKVNILSTNTELIPLHTPPNQVMFLLDLSCPKSIKLLLNANKTKRFQTPNKWLIYYDGVETIMGQLLENYFIKFSILVDSDVTLVTKTKSNYKFRVEKMYKIKENSTVYKEVIGTCTPENGFVHNVYEQVTHKRRKNLMKTVLTVIMVLESNRSLNHLTDKRDILIDANVKVNYALMEHVSDYINATFRYLFTDDWGFDLRNEPTNVVTRTLTGKKVDIGFSIRLMPIRKNELDFLVATTPLGGGRFIFRQPSLSYASNIYVLPFSRFVWISVCSLVIIIIVALWMAVKWEFKNQYKNELEENEVNNSLMEIAFLTLGALFQQGTSSIPLSTPGRIIVFSLLLSFMFLYIAYSAKIFALFYSSSGGIQTLEDLLHSRFEVGVQEHSVNRYFFLHAAEPIHKALYQQKIAPPRRQANFFHIKAGMERVRKGHFAFHIERGEAYKIISDTFLESEKCNLQEIEFYSHNCYWIPVQKNSPYKKILLVGYRLLQENGIQRRENILFYLQKPTQCLSAGFISVGLIDFYPVLEVLLIGFCTAIVILFFEIAASRFKIQICKNNRHHRILKKAEECPETEISCATDSSTDFAFIN